MLKASGRKPDGVLQEVRLQGVGGSRPPTNPPHALVAQRESTRLSAGRSRVRHPSGALGVTGLLSLGVLTGCGANNTRDQENIKSWDADYSETYTNGDGFPNTTLQCIRGAGIATTTRDLNAWQRVPAWDKFCAQFVQHPVDQSQVRKNG